jgi:DNA-binding protein WhiA
MLTFSKELKEDLIKKKINNDENLLFEYQAMMDFLGDIKFIDNEESIVFSSNSIILVNHFLKITRELFGVSTELTRVEQRTIKPFKIYSVGVNHLVSIILQRINYYDTREINQIIKLTDDQKKAYIKGAFLSSGSISNPKSRNYHLEIASESKDTVVYIQSLINYFDLNAKISTKGKKYICYIKSVNNISGFLYNIGSIKGYLELESIIEEKKMTNDIHRKMNIEIANERRTLDKASKIIEDIDKIRKKRIKLDVELELVAQLRMEHDGASLSELALKYKEKYGRDITKSSLYRKYEKIREIAEKN